MILLLVANAWAKAAPCEGLTVIGTVPSPGAPDVPLDVRLAAVASNESCLVGGGWTLALFRAEDGAAVADVGLAEEDIAAAGLAELHPPRLDPNTAYVFTAGPSEIGFTTGEGLVTGVEGTPTLAWAGATWQDAQPNFHVVSGTTLDWTVTPAADPDGLSVLQMRDALTDRDMGATIDAAGSIFWAGEVRPARVCPQVRQLDGAGLATDWSEPLCVGVGSACSTAAGPPWLGCLFAPLLLLRRVSRGRTAAPA